MTVPLNVRIGELIGWFRRPNASRLIFVLGSVFLYQVSQPGNPLPGLAFVSLVPLALGLQGASLRVALSFSFLYGVLVWLGSTTGLVFASSAYLQLSYPAAVAFVVAFCVYHALPYGIFGLLCSALPWNRLQGGILYPAACLSTTVVLFPSPMPVSLEHSLHAFPLAIQVLDLGGRPLLLFLLALGNWLVADLISRIREKRGTKSTVLGFVLLLTVVSTYGSFRLSQFDHYDVTNGMLSRIRIGVIQPNFPLPGHSGGGGIVTQHPLKTLTRLSEQLSADVEDIDLIVWPEIPYRINCSDGAESRTGLSATAVRLATPLLINCVQGEPDHGERNTALMLSSQSEIETYVKQRLFPFVEYLPGEDQLPALRRLMSGASRYVSGDRAVVFELNNAWRVFSPVCYEALFSSLVKEFVHNGGNIMVTQANDAWFGESNIGDFLIAASTLRAVSYRVPVVRVSNSGNSLGLQASGIRVNEQIAGSRPSQAKVFEVFVPSQRPPYYYLGDLTLIALSLYVGCVITWKVICQRVHL